MNRPKVSVIIPVYNVSEYIEQCARSIFEQTLDSLEILFIDDCTTDNSVDIIKETLESYPNRISQTRIIRMYSNSGQAAVRRKGIIEASGDFVIHIDGDDWIDPDYYRSMYDKAILENADIVIGDEVMEFNDHTVAKKNLPLPSSGKLIMKNWYNNPIGLFCHNKLVRHTLYTDYNILPWPNLNMWEDNGLFARLFYFAKKVVQVHGPTYHYNRMNVSAITSGYGIAQVEQMIGIATNLESFYQNKNDYSEFINTVHAFQFLAKINLITNSFKRYKRYKELFPNSSDIIKHINKSAFSKKGRIRFLMVRYHLAPIFIIMFKIRNCFK